MRMGIYQYVKYNPRYDLKVEERKGSEWHHFKRRMRGKCSMRILLRYKTYYKNRPKYGSMHLTKWKSTPKFKRRMEMKAFYKSLNK